MTTIENKDFVFVGNTTYDTMNFGLETGTFAVKLRFGPALDPLTGEYTQMWPCMVGKYALRNEVPESIIVKDAEGCSITLERALDLALGALQGRQ